MRRSNTTVNGARTNTQIHANAKTQHQTHILHQFAYVAAESDEYAVNGVHISSGLTINSIHGGAERGQKRHGVRPWDRAQ